MRICVVTPRYSLSGVPLAQIRFARALAAKGADVDLLVGTVNHGHAMPDVPGVRVTMLGRERVSRMLGPLVTYLRRERPDVVFSAEDHLNGIVLLAAMISRSRAKVSGSSRVTPFDTYRNKGSWAKRAALKLLTRATMRRADALTCVSEDMVLQYREIFPRAPHVPVYNIVVDDEAFARMREPVEDPWFARKEGPLLVAAGTLGPWKGFPDLLRAMAIVGRERPDARLVIFGEGDQRPEIEALVRELGLSERVRLPGNVTNTLKHFARADVFVLSSLVEGLPNVLVEAMLCGCTPVAVNCPTGPREVLQDGKVGYLVPMHDVHALARGMLDALDHPVPKDALRHAVRPWETELVLRRHFELLGLPEP